MNEEWRAKFFCRIEMSIIWWYQTQICLLWWMQHHWLGMQLLLSSYKRWQWLLSIMTPCSFLYWSITVNASISLPCLLLKQRKIVPIREFCMSCYVCHEWFTHWFKCGIKTRWTLSYQKWCHWRRHMILGKIYKQNWRHCQRLSELMCILTMSQDIHQNIKCMSKHYQPHSDSAFLQGQAMPTDSRWVIVLRSRPDTVTSPMLLVS